MEKFYVVYKTTNYLRSEERYTLESARILARAHASAGTPAVIFEAIELVRAADPPIIYETLELPK